MIEIFHTKFLNNDDLNSVRELYRELNYVSIYQDVDFVMLQENKNIFFLLKNNNKLLAYCIISENHLSKFSFIKTAYLNYGIISKEIEFEEKLFDFIINYLKKEKYTELILDFYLNKFTFRKYIKNIKPITNLKRATILIDLFENMDEIESNFSKDLKKNLKRAQNLNIEVREVQNDSEVEYLCVLQKKMSFKRNVFHYSDELFKKILYNFFKSEKATIFGCYYDEILIGGIVVVYQGNRAEYFIGVTDPEFRKIPQSHMTNYIAIKDSKKRGFKYYDMGGIVLNSKESDQIFHITNFKFNFSKNTSNYFPKSKIVYNHFLSILKTIYLRIA